MADFSGLARLAGGAAQAAGRGALEGGLGQAGRLVYKAGDPDEGDYFQLAFGFIPSGNLGSYLGIHNPFWRFALDAAADPFNAVLLPFEGTKLLRAAEAGRYLGSAEKLDEARKLVQLKGLSSEGGRGLEFLDAMKRGDMNTLRGMRDLLTEADAPTRALFHGEQGRAFRAALESPEPLHLESITDKSIADQGGFAGQVRRGERGLLSVRTPFGLRTLLGDYEKTLVKGEWLADTLQKTPYLSRWLEKVGTPALRDMAIALHAGDAADAAWHSVAQAGAATRELADLGPQFKPLADQVESLVADAAPLRAEYRAARTANRVQYTDLRTLLDTDETWLRQTAAAAAEGDLRPMTSYVSETAAVAGGSDVSSNFVPFLQSRREGFQKLRELAPPEVRRLLGSYDESLAAAIKDPAKARELAGPDAWRKLVSDSGLELSQIEKQLAAGGEVTAEQAAKRVELRNLQGRQISAAHGEAQAIEATRTALEARHRALTLDIERLTQESEAAQAEFLAAGKNAEPARGPVSGAAGSEAQVRMRERADKSAAALKAAESEIGRVEAQLAGQAEAVPANLAARPAAHGLGAEVSLERTPAQALAEGTRKSIAAGRDFVARVEASLPTALTADLPEVERVRAAAGNLAERLDRTAALLPKLATEVRSLSGTRKIGAEAATGRLVQAIGAMADYVGIVRGGEAGAAVRQAIGAAWPELGRELERNHRAVELPTTSRALESDVLAAWNPAQSVDYGGEGRGLQNLYGAGPHPLSMADAHMAYEGQTMFRVRAYLDRHRETWAGLSANPERAIEWMKGFQLSGREEAAFLDTLSKEEVGLFKSVRRMLLGAEAIGHGRWYEQAVVGYFPIVTRAGRRGEAVYQRALGELSTRFRSGIESRHFKTRFSEGLDALLELERQGILKVEKDPRRIISGYMDALTRVSANQRLYDQMAHARGLDGLPLLVEKSTAGRVGQALGLESGWLDRYVAIDGRKFPALAGNLIHADHADVLDVFGPRTISEVIKDDSPFWRALQRVNLAAKGGILSFSFFHAVAQSATILMYAGMKRGGQFLLSAPIAERIGLGLKKGEGVRLGNLLQLYGESGQVVEQALRYGMEWEPFDKLASDQFRGFMGNLVQSVRERAKVGPGGPMRVLTSPITGLAHLNDLSHTITWEYVHNSGKAFLYSENLQRLMTKFPDAPFEDLARQAAATANSGLGGLNWRKVFGDARVRARLQTIMLAPDWTLSNLAQARDFFVGALGPSLRRDSLGRLPIAVRDVANPTMAATLARRFWLNWAMSGFLTMQALNVAFTGHTTFENPGGPENALQIDLNRKDSNGRPVFLSFGKQFLEPFQLVMDPMKFLLGKAAPLPNAIATVLQQRDRFGGPITVPTDSTSQKVKANLGWVVKSVLPIPGQGFIRAVEQAKAGKPDDALRTWMNMGTSMFDVQIRPVPILEGKVNAEAVVPHGGLEDDLPRAMGGHVGPAPQRRYVWETPQ